MIISKYTTISLAVLAVSLTTACAANSADMATEKTVQSYLKPGAAITYSHSLKSQVNAGETTTFNLNLNENYGEGLLVVNVSAEGDLTLYPSSTQKRFQMIDDISHNMNVSFTANSNGRHYINVQAFATDASGQTQPRMFSIPVQVGPPAPLKANADMTVTPDGENIIEMTAEEEIK